MTEHVLPEYVNDFINALKIYLDEYNATLIIKDNLLHRDQPAILYEVSGAPWTPSLILHQTERSLNLQKPVYRVRLGTTFPDDMANWLRGKEGMANRFASLAAVVTSEEKVDVLCQCVLTEENAAQFAYMMSVAAVYGASTITESIKVMMEGTNHQVEEISAWTDLDFEQVHYDFAHLGIGQIGKRHWSMRTLNGHLELSADHHNPYWNAGLLSLAYYNKKQLGIADGTVTANDLNQATFMLDDTPMYGAWCDDKDDLVFVTFIPNFMKSIPDITDQLVSWFMQRSRSIYSLIPELKNQIENDK